MKQEKLTFSIGKGTNPDEVKRGLDILAMYLRAENGKGTSRSALIELLGLAACDYATAERIAEVLAPILGIDLDKPYIL